MKIRIELDESLTEEEVVIYCWQLGHTVLEIQRMVSDIIEKKKRFPLYQKDKEFYIPLENVLFFETAEKGICAHTAEEVYQVRYKLYELEKMLPGIFMRVSKSTILNTGKIYSLERKLPMPCVVQFQNSHKQVFVSRYYYKPLQNRLEEERYLK